MNIGTLITEIGTALAVGERIYKLGKWMLQTYKKEGIRRASLKKSTTQKALYYTPNLAFQII